MSQTRIECRRFTCQREIERNKFQEFMYEMKTGIYSHLIVPYFSLSICKNRASFFPLSCEIEMGRPPKSRPSFFKIMLGDFTSKLIIPPQFAKKHEGMFSHKCILKTDDNTEKSWPVKIDYDRTEYFFSHGWKKFAKDNYVEIGDFLVFFLIGLSSFKVMIYGRSGCQKSLNSVHFENGEPTWNPTVKIEETESDEEVIEIPHFSTKTEHPHFEKLIMKHNKYIMAVPKEFAVKTRILRKREIVLKDPERRAWPIKVYPTVTGYRVEMRSGWCAFRKGNDLEEGDKCLFQFIGDGVIEVRFVRKERGGSRRRRAGRSCECGGRYI